MKLCLDIGNSTVAIGLFAGQRLVQRASLFHGGKLISEKFQEFLEKFLGARSVRRAGLISVVPKFIPEAEQAVARLLRLHPRVITVKSLGTMKHGYRHPQRLGIDRLINGLAARRLYGAPCLVVDIGTAITCDAVDRAGRFLGGAIAPGPDLMAGSLWQHTALLPEVRIARQRRAIGRDTEESIRSGIYWGTLGLVQELVRRMSAEISGRPRVILTGGRAQTFRNMLPGYRYDPDLTLKGVALACDDV